jgi:hypothetical protein
MGMEQALRSGLFFLQAGDACAAWDFEARGGMIGGVRILTAVEDIAAGNQLVRVRSWPAWPYQLIIVVGLLIALALAAACDQAWLASILLGLPAIAILTRGCYEAGRVQSLVSHVLAGLAFKPVVQKRPRSVALAEL